MRSRRFDYQLATLTVVMVGFGLMMMYSASGIWADQRYNDAFFFLKRQTVWAALGLIALWRLSLTDYNKLRRWIWPALGLTAVMLCAVLLTNPVAGARRWLRAGPIGIQPAEAAKFVLLFFLADYLDRKRSKSASFVHGLIIPWSVIGGTLGLILLEPDLGTPALIFAAATMVIFIGGGQLRYVFGMIAAAVPLLIYELLRYPYRRQRLFSFMTPWADPQGAGYQLVQSLLAVGSGGWLGRGLGASQLKLMYLPAPHTDFIFPIIAEELGLLGSVSVLGLFAWFLARGMKIARSAPNLFGTLLASGITLIITLQAMFNIAMSIGLLPTKGVPLPFFSFGGSSLLMTLSAVGVLLNISSQSKRAA